MPRLGLRRWTVNKHIPPVPAEWPPHLIYLWRVVYNDSEPLVIAQRLHDYQGFIQSKL